MSVTLKELRISKGLNQAQCAKYLGMSTRNYQNYENDAAKSKYSQIPCDLSKAGKLWSACCLGFLTLANNRVSYECCHGYRLAGVGKQRGKGTASVTASAPCRSLWLAPTMGRSVFYTVSVEPERQHFCFQMLSDLPIEKTAYIKAQTTDDMSRLTKGLESSV